MGSFALGIPFAKLDVIGLKDSYFFFRSPILLARGDYSRLTIRRTLLINYPETAPPHTTIRKLLSLLYRYFQLHLPAAEELLMHIIE